MNYSIKESAHYLLVKPQADLVGSQTGDLIPVWQQAAQLDKDLLIDLQLVERIDMAGLHMLDEIYRNLLDEGRRVVLLDLKHAVAGLLELTHMNLWISAYQDIDAYLRRYDYSSDFYQPTY